MRGIIAGASPIRNGDQSLLFHPHHGLRFITIASTPRPASTAGHRACWCASGPPSWSFRVELHRAAATGAAMAQSRRPASTGRGAVLGHRRAARIKHQHLAGMRVRLNAHPFRTRQRSAAGSRKPAPAGSWPVWLATAGLFSLARSFSPAGRGTCSSTSFATVSSDGHTTAGAGGFAVAAGQAAVRCILVLRASASHSAPARSGRYAADRPARRPAIDAGHVAVQNRSAHLQNRLGLKAVDDCS
jgi:hypothetical protein